MAAFTPTTREFDSPNAPDWLASGALTALLRDFTGLSWGPIKTLIAGAISAGLLPLLMLPEQLRTWMKIEQNQIDAFHEWETHETPRVATRGLLQNALNVLTIALAFVCLGVFALYLLQHAPTQVLRALFIQRGHPLTFFSVLWVALLALAYALHFVSVSLRISSLRQTIRIEPAGLGSATLLVWFAVGVLLLVAGAWWGLP